jgi:isochorismate synthase EntC
MKARHLQPWLVKQRDFVRYLGRALAACAAGRVIFFYHRDCRDKKILIALAPYPDWKQLVQAAGLAVANGRYRKVVLANLPRRKRKARK